MNAQVENPVDSPANRNWPRLSIRQLLTVVLLLSVVLAMFVARINYTIETNSASFVNVGDTIDVFEWPGPEVDTDGGFELHRVVRDARLVAITKRGDCYDVKLKVHLIDAISLSKADNGFLVDRNASDRPTYWVD